MAESFRGSQVPKFLRILRTHIVFTLYGVIRPHSCNGKISHPLFRRYKYQNRLHQYKFFYRLYPEHIRPIIFQNGVRFIIGNTQCARQPHESTVGIIIPVGTLSTTPPRDPALLCGVSCTQQYQLLYRGRKENILAAAAVRVYSFPASMAPENTASCVNSSRSAMASCAERLNGSL